MPGQKTKASFGLGEYETQIETSKMDAGLDQRHRYKYLLILSYKILQILCKVDYIPRAVQSKCDHARVGGCAEPKSVHAWEKYLAKKCSCPEPPPPSSLSPRGQKEW